MVRSCTQPSVSLLRITMPWGQGKGKSWGAMGEVVLSHVSHLLSTALSSMSPAIPASFHCALACWVLPWLLPASQGGSGDPLLPAARQSRQCQATSPSLPPARGAHSLLRWQRFRASCRAPSTRSTLPLVELQPMRPMRRTWEEKGECLCLSSPVWSGGHTARCERESSLAPI